MAQVGLFRREAVQASLESDTRGGILKVVAPRLLVLWVILVALLVAALVASFLVRVQERASGRGRLVPLPADAPLVAFEAGRVAEVHAEPSAEVGAGQILVTLRDEALGAARTSAEGRRAALEQALTAARLAGSKELEAEVQRDLSSARAELDALASRAARLELRAPVDGRLVRFSVAPGDWLEAGRPVGAVRRSDATLVGHFELPATHRRKLAVGMEVRLRLDGLGLASGRIKTIGEPDLADSERSELLPIAVELDSPGELGDELFAGAAFTGEVVVGQPRLIGLLFPPLASE